MQSTLNLLKVHTFLVVASLVLFVWSFLEMVIKPNNSDYAAHSCLHLIEKNSTNSQNAIGITIVIIIILAGLTISRCVSHVANYKRECIANPYICANYKVSGLFMFLSNENTLNSVLNGLLLLCHVTTVTTLSMMIHAINATKDATVLGGKKDSCEIDNDRASITASCSLISLVCAVLLEVAMSYAHFAANRNKQSDTVVSAAYSFSLDSVKQKFKENVESGYETGSPKTKTYAYVRFAMLFAVALVTVLGFFTSIAEGLECSETDIRLLLFATIFAIEATIVSAVRPAQRSKQFITALASLAVLGYISLNYVHFIQRPAATACTEPQSADGKRSTLQSNLRDYVTVSLYLVVAFGFLELLYTMWCCMFPHKASKQIVDADESAAMMEMTNSAKPRSSKPQSLQFV